MGINPNTAGKATQGKRLLVAIPLVCAIGLGGLALASTPDMSVASEATPAPAASAEAVNTAQDGITNADINDSQYPGKSYWDERWSYWADVAQECAPEIRTLPDGTMVQRTPTEYAVDPAAWQVQAGSNSYNTFWLNADERGCQSCHPDLNEVLASLPFEHPIAWNDALDNEMTVQQCLFCHSYAPGYIAKQYEFGTLIHGIHYGKDAAVFEDAYEGSCMSCHNATENGMGMELWDLTKYDRLWGINDVADVQGEFSYDQEAVQSMSDVFSYDWVHSYYDYMRRGAGEAGLDLEMPMSLLETWPVTIEGNVNEPYTATLGELIAEAEAQGVTVTKVSKMACNWNPVGGGGVANCEITGIPVSWLVEKAGGYKDGTTGIRVLRADGSSKRAFPIDKLDDNEAYLVYKIGGEYLDATRGFPCTNWVEGGDAQINSKQPSTYLVTDEDIDYKDKWAGIPSGWQNADGVPMNNPNATILGVPEGLIIQNGEPYTFNGYVEAFDQAVDYLEISMDRGTTWTRYDIENMDPNKALWWSFTWTPEIEGSCCLTVRAATESGVESYETQTVMFNAKDVIPNVEETTQLSNGVIVAPKNVDVE